MSYGLEVSEHLLKIFKKLKKRDPVQAYILKCKIKQILNNPLIGKPLTSDMANQRRVHIRHFVLTYESLEKEKLIRLLDYAHHDDVYD